VVSDYQVQLGHEVRALKEKNRLKTCRDFEESEGRINSDNLHRFIVIGGPHFEANPDPQDKLVNQVKARPVLNHHDFS
jgi:hypothetical protein